MISIDANRIQAEHFHLDEMFAIRQTKEGQW